MYSLKEVVIEITTQCNLSCLHCGSACGHYEDPRELSVEQWFGVIDQLRAMGCKKIIYSGGEPLLKKGIADIIRYTHTKGIRYGLITNGISLSDEMLALFKEYPPFSIGISIDGEADTHNRIRNYSQAHLKSMSHALQLLSEGIPVCIVTTVNQLNYTELPSLAKYFNFFGITSWQIQLATPFGRMKEHPEWLITEDIFQEVCRTIASLRKSFPEIRIEAADCFGVAPAGSIRKHDWGGCSAGIQGCGIDAFGNVMPCLSLRIPFPGNNCVTERPLQEIWDYSPCFDFNRLPVSSACTSTCSACDLFHQCKGGCASLSMAYTDSFHATPFCFYRSFHKQVCTV